MQFMYSVFFLIIQSFCLYSYENSGNDHSHHMPQVEIKINNPHVQQKSCDWKFSGNVTVISDPSYRYAANYSVITQQASPELKHYFDHIVTPLMYYTTVQDHCCVLPGYIFPAGLRSCIQQLSQFSHSDPSTIPGLTQRLETYCTRIENILFNVSST
jgi:hypothetical protein